MNAPIEATTAARHEASPEALPPASSGAQSGGSGRGEGFNALLDTLRQRLERELAGWLDGRRAAVPADVAEGEAVHELIDAVSVLAGQGGKRLRPALVYYTYRACNGGSDEAVLPLALATELLHTYLLLHDDVMDHAEVRRGLPTAHAHFRELHRARGLQGDPADFGRSVAILVGDLAHSWAVELFAGVLAQTPRAAEMRRCFGAMCEEVVGGQYQELLAAARRGTPQQAGEEELLAVLRLKSGRYTAERPIQLGALLADAPPETVDALCRYGAAVGEAFQLQDDLLGVFGDPETVGKPVGADLEEGKFTFLIWHALRAAGPAERAEIEGALGRTLTAAEVDRLCRLLESTGARAAVTAMVEERLETARAALTGLTLTPQGRVFFEGLLDALWERKR